jgi:OOP family OmpA-OmpF porin
MDVKSELFGDSRKAFTTGGLGINLRLGQGPASLNAEYRVRRSNDGPGFTDNIATLGLSFAFGEKPRAMPIPAAAAPDPDSDGDGVPNSRDACPDTPAGHKVDSRGCSLDSDGDGVVDADDACPNTFRGAAVDARGCEMDDDKDGVVNRLDQCPNTVAGARVDTKGCEIRDVIELPGVNFETNSDRLLPGANSTLLDAATTLRRYPELVVEVAGHTDSDGAAEYNQGLSERRAITVRDYLINEGVRQGRLSARGYGEAEPVADNTTAVGKAKNRRVELRIREESRP